MTRSLWWLLIWFIGLSPTQAVEKDPLWEIGLGASALSFPAYPGSSQQHAYLLPLPYVIYHGERIRVDREGLRGLLYDRAALEVNLSLTAAVPVRSGDLPVREGMESLSPAIELGPSFNWLLGRPANGTRVRLRVPVRGVFPISAGGIEHVGWRINPHLNWDIPAASGWRYGANVGLMFADRRYHDHYYGVAPRYATLTRNSYTAGAGYGGASLTLSATRRYENYWFGTFLRYENLAGASFRDSPLVETRHALLGGVGLAWIVRRIPRP